MVPLGCRKWSPPLPRPSVSFTVISNNAKENGPLRRYTGECALRYLCSPDLRLGLKKKPRYVAHPLPSSIQSPRNGNACVAIEEAAFSLVFWSWDLSPPPHP